ncbi:hypothetical protein DL764_006677 [Monosporascus ibericus]|uniref:Transferrin receptor-like dimerisation domain-containing protein n=1 Tax=Monosporascus ibericus TaxID=155417 RepID=A0A4Q4T7L0_9PEZI|nr:hypothetical protein DL764_006677 [Monosporascus ibericus]
MPSDEKSHYTPAPPIPSYHEATRGASSSRADWQQPPRSPLDARAEHETEAQSLLNTSQPRQQRNRQAPGGYRQPYVESDGEGSDWTLESDDDDDDHEEVRREMQELEVEDPLNGSTTSRSSSLWRKPISFSLPQWRWRWRLPRLTVRLPRANDDASNTENTNGDNEGASESESERRRWWQWRPRWRPPPISSSAALLLMGRLLAAFLVIGFLWLLFMSDVFTSMSRRIGGQMFDPEQVRQHVVHMVDPAQMHGTLRHFTSYAHIAGTEGDWALARDVRNAFLRDGLEDVVVDEYQVYMNYPRPDGRAVEILSGEGDGQKAIWKAKLEEMDIGDETAGRPTLAFHGHSKSGDVRGPLIYANYGSREDFKKLGDMEIDVKGAIALVRYSGIQDEAALKVKAAEIAGFAGCLIYSDPADDGFVRGDVAPNGRFLPADGVRRDSVSLSNWVIGDVLTPGWESKPGQPRETLEQTKGLVGIPSLPLAWRDAQALLQHISGFGEKVPGAWRGAVPDVGDVWWSGNASGPVVRLKNDQDEETLQAVWNVHGRIRGLEQGDKKIFIGNQRDALSFGAADPGSGTAVMLEVVRVLGDLAARGWRPLRTVEFASWDGGAHNRVGSTEFVENNLEALQADAYAYVNLGAAIRGGTRLRARGSPVFSKALARVLDRVVDPSQNASLRTLWGENDSNLRPLNDAAGDYAAFQDIAGASSLDLDFEGEESGDSYYPRGSSYDTFDWMTRVGDPEFAYHALLAQVVLLLVLELADRPVLPFDMSSYAQELNRYVGQLGKWVEDGAAAGKQRRQDNKARSGDDGDNGKKKTKLDIGKIEAAVRKVGSAVADFERWEQIWETSIIRSNGWEPSGLGKQRCVYNDRMAEFETALLDLDFGGGIPNRTQFKHVVYGPQLWPDEDGFAFFPAIRDAVDAGDMKLARILVDKTARLINDAANALLSLD